MPLVSWVDEVPAVEIDGDGVRVACRSGGATFLCRMSRATFRRHIERGLRLLDEADMDARAVVSLFKDANG